ncbi:MAG TPA: DUF433 domain-containing protein [Anaerolineae bacterium]
MLVEPEARVYEHIAVVDGIPRIAGTRYKVIHLALERMAYGWSPEELQYQHPDLSLGQIYAALAYYVDHQEELDHVIEEQAADYDRLRAAAENSPLRQRLRAQGLIK